MVPVLTRSLGGGEPSRHLLVDKPLNVSDAPPVVLNAGGSGVFRSRYGHAELAAIAEHIGDLEELERATFIADGWASLFAGQIVWKDFLAMAQGLGDQDEPTPWGSVASALDYVDRALDADQREGFVKSVRQLFDPQFARLGWDATPGEGELTPQVRAIVLSVLGTIGGDESIKAEAVRRFEANNLDGNLANAMLRIVARQNRPGDYETFLERYRHAATPQDAQRYLWRGIPEFPDERVALDAAEKCFSEFRNQDAAIVLALLSRNAVSGPTVWKYFTSRWDDAMAHFPQNSHSRLALGVPTFIKDEALADTVEAFHTSHPVFGGQRTIEQDLERMRVGLVFAAAMRQQF
jgi:hypothetical protein